MATGITTYYIPSESGNMVKCGTLYCYGRIKVTETWDDTANTSSFTFVLQGRLSTSSLSAAYIVRGDLDLKATVDGTALSYSLFDSYTYNHVKVTTEFTDIMTVTVSNVPHNADGSLSITLNPTLLSGYTYFQLSQTYNGTTYKFWYLSADTSITCHKNTIGSARIDNGSSFDLYQAYIDNGSSWDLYVPYEDNGSSWDLCGG